MSTTWYVPVGPNAKNAELAIRKMTGWTKVSCEENTKTNQVLTDGYYFVHCDREPIEIIDHGKYAVMELYSVNQNLGEVLYNIDDAVTDANGEPPVINCDNCGGYMLTSEMYVTPNESIVCRKCHKKKK